MDRIPPIFPDGLTRRHFLGQLAAGAAFSTAGRLRGEPADDPSVGFQVEAASLLHDWCEGLLRRQITVPENPALHGALRCPACPRIHGRCGDAILPLLSMAARSGDERYRDAALALWGWMKNVDSPDGAWTNETDPKSWKGTTIFSAIALAESLEWHAVLLDEATRAAMRQRLKLAGEFILAEFTTEYGNINYAAAGAYGLTLLGHLLDEPKFTTRGRELARQVLAFFTPKDRFLFGEGHPFKQSGKGCYPIDLGYNVEESLPSLVHYALLTEDKEVLDAATQSLRTHLEFMLPDGAWDNSWGTRSYKWTYWGSSTADGCQSAFVRLAAAEPVFATAALANLRLLRSCTHDGLLHGGPHFKHRGAEACIHHTFAHAKTVAAALHYLPERANPAPTPALPQSIATGVRHFPEIDVHLAALGPWRATVSGCDWFYRPGLYQATGGTLGMLWHQRLGPVLAAGIADYLPVEAANMQPVPDGGAFPLGCRVEIKTTDGSWFTNLHDGTARIRHESDGNSRRFEIEARLLTAQGKPPAAGEVRFRIEYTLNPDSFSIRATPLDSIAGDWSLVVPVISHARETLKQVKASRWEIAKPAGSLAIDSDQAVNQSPLAFNLIPGFQAIPFSIVSSGAESVQITLHSSS